MTNIHQIVNVSEVKDHSKVCNGKIILNNAYQSLSLEKCDEGKLLFRHVRGKYGLENITDNMT